MSAPPSSGNAAQQAYESAPGALYKIMPWHTLPAYWQAYWAQRAAGTL